MNKIIRQMAILFYSIGFFELLKYLFPEMNRDWIFIVLFVTVMPIIILCSLREYDEWHKNYKN